GGNNVTLSQNGQSITISANTVAAATLSVSAGTTTTAAAGITFSNSNGFSFGLNNGTITAAQSVQTQASGNIAGTNTNITGNASITLNSSGISFNGSGLAGTNLSLTTTAGSSLTATLNSSGLTLAMPAWLTTQTVQTQNNVDVTLGGNSTSGGAGYILISSGTLFLAGGPNVTLSQNGQSVSISANTVAAASLSISAGTTSSGYGGITFANSNGITWGLNNGTIT